MGWCGNWNRPRFKGINLILFNNGGLVFKFDCTIIAPFHIPRSEIFLKHDFAGMLFNNNKLNGLIGVCEGTLYKQYMRLALIKILFKTFT